MVTQNEIKKEAEKFLHGKNWKPFAILGAVCLVLLVLINSLLFAFALALIKFVLFIGGFIALVYAFYLAWPLLVDWYKNQSK